MKCLNCDKECDIHHIERSFGNIEISVCDANCFLQLIYDEFICDVKRTESPGLKYKFRDFLYSLEQRSKGEK